MKRKYGIFRIALPLFDLDYGAVQAALSSCIVLRAEVLYVDDCIEYTAYSSQFSEIIENGVIPRYNVVINRTEPLGQLSARFE